MMNDITNGRAMRRSTMSRDKAKAGWKGSNYVKCGLTLKERRQEERLRFDWDYETTIRYAENGLDLDEWLALHDPGYEFENEMDAVVQPAFYTLEEAAKAISTLEDNQSISWTPKAYPRKTVTVKRYAGTLIGWRNTNARRWHDASRAADYLGAIRMIAGLKTLLEAR